MAASSSSSLRSSTAGTEAPYQLRGPAYNEKIDELMAEMARIRASGEADRDETLTGLRVRELERNEATLALSRQIDAEMKIARTAMPDYSSLIALPDCPDDYMDPLDEIKANAIASGVAWCARHDIGGVCIECWRLQRA